jgi:hypothetical protein
MDVKGNQRYNPFKPIHDDVKRKFFTGRFSDESLQPFLDSPLYEQENKSRGNLGIARQNDRPNWLRKQEFLSFAAVRSYPHRQFRHVIQSLVTGNLPLDKQQVQTLLEHAVFHLGTLEFENCDGVSVPCLSWRTDLTLENGPLQGMVEALDYVLDLIKDAVKKRQCLTILGELCAFVADRTETGIALWHKCAAIPRQWAYSLAQQSQGSQPDPKMRLKQCVYYLYSIACYRYGPIDELAVKNILELNVMIQERLVYKAEVLQGCSREEKLELEHLEAIHQQVMAAHYHLVENACVLNGQLLTGVILHVIEDAPLNLDWTRVDSGKCCFQAIAAENELYSINVFNGVVLKNGVPPQRLVSL